MDKYACQLGKITNISVLGMTGLFSERVTDNEGMFYAYIPDASKAQQISDLLESVDNGAPGKNHDWQLIEEGYIQREFNEALAAGNVGTLVEDGKPIGYLVGNSIATLFLLDVLNGRPGVKPMIHADRMGEHDQRLVNEGRADMVKKGFTLW